MLLPTTRCLHFAHIIIHIITSSTDMYGGHLQWHDIQINGMLVIIVFIVIITLQVMAFILWACDYLHVAIIGNLTCTSHSFFSIIALIF